VQLAGTAWVVQIALQIAEQVLADFQTELQIAEQVLADLQHVAAHMSDV
jgi:hypothetical protein